MSDHDPAPGKEVWAVFLGFLTVGLLLLCVFALFRVIVPAILEAHFTGSTFLAATVGFFGTGGIVLLALFLFSRVARLFSR